jgi:hypothetical protein
VRLDELQRSENEIGCIDCASAAYGSVFATSILSHGFLSASLFFAALHARRTHQQSFTRERKKTSENACLRRRRGCVNIRSICRISQCSFFYDCSNSRCSHSFAFPSEYFTIRTCFMAFRKCNNKPPARLFDGFRAAKKNSQSSLPAIKLPSRRSVFCVLPFNTFSGVFFVCAPPGK